MNRASVSRNLYLASLLVGVVLVISTLALFARLPLVTSGASGTQIWVTDETGTLLYSAQPEPLPYPWAEIDRSDTLFALSLTHQSTLMGRMFSMKISEHPTRYLIASPRLAKWLMRTYLLLFLVFAVFGINAIYAALLTAYARRRGREVQAVVSRLKAGDLRARFRVSRLDEIGRSMQSFNEMADEIERLVRRVQTAEAQRSQLLRELAHDVRTPLTGLSYLIESVSEDGADLEPAEVTRKMRRANQELEYFKRLIEDLFLLAETEESRRTVSRESVALHALAAAEIAELGGGAIELILDAGDATLDGESFLLKRFLRNAITNALRFARTRVTVRVKADGAAIVFECEDDGPGLSPEAIESFGRRRTSRFLDMSAGGKPSLGLGSVIMRRVAEIHGGEISIENWFQPDGGVGGARLRAVFPARFTMKEAA